MRWSVPLLAFALFAKAAPAEACKCRRMIGADVARHAVFAGKAVEYLEREEPSGGLAWSAHELNAATRFVVEFSNEFPSGSSVVVLGNHNSDCNAWFEVGDHHLVVASRVGDVLVGGRCAEMLGSDLEQQASPGAKARRAAIGCEARSGRAVQRMCRKFPFKRGDRDSDRPFIGGPPEPP